MGGGNNHWKAFSIGGSIMKMWTFKNEYIHLPLSWKAPLFTILTLTLHFPNGEP